MTPTKPAIVSECTDADDAPESETREERFRRIGAKRVTRTLKEISLLGNLTGSNYKFTEADVARMFAAIESSLQKTRAAFDAVLAHAARDKQNFDF